MSEKKNLRRHPRGPSQGVLKVAWTDGRGNFRRATGKCLDISVSGVRLELSEPVEARTLVHVESAALQIFGTASVRYCERFRLKYLVGLEFSGGLQYRS
jgi:hypothetical protein